MIDLNEMAQSALEIAKGRAIENVDTHTLLKHCATEVVEAARVYTNVEMSEGIKKRVAADDELPDGTLEEASSFFAQFHERFAGEVVDVVMCALIIAAQEEIDIEEELRKRLEKNKRRAECAK